MRPRQEPLAEHDTQNDQNRCWGQAKEVERRVGGRESQSPPVQVVEAEADEDDCGRRQNDAYQVDLDLRAAAVRLEAEA